MHNPKIAALCAVVAMCAAGPALAQAAPETPAPAAADPAASPEAPPEAETAPAPTMAPAGSVIDIEITEQVSSKTHKHGDKFAIKLISPISVDGVILAPAGAVGVGEVVDSGPPGMGGKPGKLVLAARYIVVDGVQVPLRSFKVGGAGKDNTNMAMAVSSIPYVGVAGIFIQGGNIVFSPGTRASAKLAADFTPVATTQASTAPVDPTAAPAAAATTTTTTPAPATPAGDH